MTVTKCHQLQTQRNFVRMRYIEPAGQERDPSHLVRTSEWNEKIEMELSPSFEYLYFKDYFARLESLSCSLHMTSANPINATNLKQMAQVYALHYNTVQKLGQESTEPGGPRFRRGFEYTLAMIRASLTVNSVLTLFTYCKRILTVRLGSN